MKTAFALLFAPLAVVYSLEGDAEVFNLNFEAKSGLALRGANNIKQCYNHCKRHNGKSTEWKSLCMQRCDDEYGPANPGWNGYCDGSPQYHCYSNGWPDCCEQNDGLNCPRKPPACDVQPSGHSCNRSCRTDSDCMSYQRGGFVQCAKCGQYKGARYYQLCYSGDDEDEAAEPIAEYAADDGSKWDDIKNGTKKAWDDVKNGTKKVADESAEWTKNAADKTADAAEEEAKKAEDWGKETFEPSSGYYASSCALLVAGLCTIPIFLA